MASYGAEMFMRDIPEERRLAGFPRVAMSGIHAEVLEVRVESRPWEEFESRLLEKYGLDDALRLSKRDFMEWVESPGKGRNTSVLLREFEETHRYSFRRLTKPSWTRAGSYYSSSRWTSGIGIRWAPCWKPKTG